EWTVRVRQCLENIEPFDVQVKPSAGALQDIRERVRFIQVNLGSAQLRPTQEGKTLELLVDEVVPDVIEEEIKLVKAKAEQEQAAAEAKKFRDDKERSQQKAMQTVQTLLTQLNLSTDEQQFIRVLVDEKRIGEALERLELLQTMLNLSSLPTDASTEIRGIILKGDVREARHRLDPFLSRSRRGGRRQRREHEEPLTSEQDRRRSREHWKHGLEGGHGRPPLSGSSMDEEEEYEKRRKARRQAQQQPEQQSIRQSLSLETGIQQRGPFRHPNPRVASDPEGK